MNNHCLWCQGPVDTDHPICWDCRQEAEQAKWEGYYADAQAEEVYAQFAEGEDKEHGPDDLPF